MKDINALGVYFFCFKMGNQQLRPDEGKVQRLSHMRVHI